MGKKNPRGGNQLLSERQLPRQSVKCQAARNKQLLPMAGRQAADGSLTPAAHIAHCTFLPACLSWAWTRSCAGRGGGHKPASSQTRMLEGLNGKSRSKGHAQRRGSRSHKQVQEVGPHH